MDAPEIHDIVTSAVVNIIYRSALYNLCWAPEG
jgi:hypothetical protein